MTTPTGNRAAVEPDRFGDPTLEVVASRRQALAFLGAFGLVVPTASLIAAIDSSVSKANAQAAPGQPVPRLAVYTPNWPDMVELWRQLSRDWAALGIDLDVQQGTLDTFVSQIVAEQKNPNGFPSYARNQFTFDGFLRHQAHGPAGTTLRRTAAYHCNQTLFLAIIEHFRRPRPLSFIESALQAALLVSTANVAYGLGGERDYVGDLRCAGALRQLQQSQGT